MNDKNSVVRERPIPFKAPMVRAILEGRKTQTRRVVMPQPTPVTFRGKQHGWRFKHGTSMPLNFRGQSLLLQTYECPYGQPGDRLWVRESFWISDCRRYLAIPSGQSNHIGFDVLSADGNRRWLDARYTATGFDDTDHRYTHWEFPRVLTYYSVYGKQGFKLGFCDVDQSVQVRPPRGIGSPDGILRRYEAIFTRRRPSIHMPRRASRLMLEILKVRVERVQEITREDCLAEGIGSRQALPNDTPAITASWPIQCFRQLWDSINAKPHRVRNPETGRYQRFPGGFGWDVNPWVWVIEFKKLEARQ